MLNSLSSRLWLTYAFLAGIVLCILSAGITIYLLRNPLPARLAYQRLEAVMILFQQGAPILENRTDGSLQNAAERADQSFDTRILVFTPQGNPIVDSRASTGTPFPRQLLLNLVSRSNNSSAPTFRDGENRLWMYALRHLPDGNYLLVASLRPRLTLRQILSDEMIRLLVRTALFALGISLLLAIWVTGWVTAPLKRIMQASQAVAKGQFRQIPLEGPDEVQELAGSFNQMTERVLSSQQSQREFIANVSHELKTPLTSIQGFAQAILDGTVDKPPELHQAGEVIYNEADRMHRLVLDLLELARLDAGTAELKRAPLDLNLVLRDVRQRFAPLAAQLQVSLELEAGPLPLLQGDEDRLSQVFSNLVDNALKFTPPGGTVQINARQQDSQAIVQVIDSGPGIPDEDLPRIFERFFQVDKSRRGGRRHGVGLGLAIAREIILAHEGSLEVHNNRQEDPFHNGCTFTVRLPSVSQGSDAQQGRHARTGSPLSSELHPH